MRVEGWGSSAVIYTYTELNSVDSEPAGLESWVRFLSLSPLLITFQNKSSMETVGGGTLVLCAVTAEVLNMDFRQNQGTKIHALPCSRSLVDIHTSQKPGMARERFSSPSEPGDMQNTTP